MFSEIQVDIVFLLNSNSKIKYIAIEGFSLKIIII